MKVQTEIIFTKISKEHKNALTTIVKETLAIGIVPVKFFSIIDLWNIQRGRKEMKMRRHLV